jgi:hypothetical protein
VDGHICDRVDAANVHAQTLYAIPHDHMAKSRPTHLELPRTLSEQRLPVPDLHALCGHKQLHAQPGTHATLAKVRLRQLTYVEAQALAARASANMHVEFDLERV